MSDLLAQLIEKGVLQKGIWETIYLTFISAFFSYIIGLPLGVLLVVGEKGGVCPIPVCLLKALNVVIAV